MRNISPASLAKLGQRLGTEAIFIIEVAWNNGPRSAYADRTVSGVAGRILSVSELDNTVTIGSSDSQQISITLDDTSGELKTILDTVDIHKKPVWIYQTFDGLPLSDKFLLFRGQINSPVEYQEGDRTLSFDVVNRIEDREVGFSIEEGNILNPPEEAIGKPWPLCFGTVVNVPALRLKATRQGTLATGVGIKDFMLDEKLQASHQLQCGAGQQIGWKGVITGSPGENQIDGLFAADNDCLKRRCEEQEYLRLQIEEQTAAEASQITIFGGRFFPQNQPVKIDINGAKFYGSFNGNLFTITGREHPKMGPDGKPVQDQPTQVIDSICIGQNFEPVGDQENYSSWLSRRSWEIYDAVKLAGFHWANAGEKVTLDEDSEIIYIANILPSTVLRVAAYRTVEDGRRLLLTVPETYYTVRQVDYTGYQVVEIVMSRPLSERGDGWEDDLFITLTSGVGPNTVDILRWFIETYTSYQIDSSFDVAFDQVAAYPMHFALLERKNIIQVLEEIAFQARCAIFLRDDVFHLMYLPAEPTTVDSITVSDTVHNTTALTMTTTEDIVTKLVATWKKDYAAGEDNKFILRHNVSKYGTHELAYHFYCFAHLELVQKAATFWLIRKANTWRKVRFSTPLNKLAIETYDAIELNLALVSDAPIKCIVEKAEYDSSNNTVAFELWTPLKSGTRTPYDFAYPSQVSTDLIFPTQEEEAAGFAGSGGGPSFTVIAPKKHPLSNFSLVNVVFN